MHGDFGACGYLDEHPHRLSTGVIETSDSLLGTLQRHIEQNVWVAAWRLLNATDDVPHDCFSETLLQCGQGRDSLILKPSVHVDRLLVVPEKMHNRKINNNCEIYKKLHLLGRVWRQQP